MLSLKSLLQQLGAALGLILAGAIAEVYSTPAAWMAGAVFLIVAVILISILAKRLAAEPQ
jgi:MFS family permease